MKLLLLAMAVAVPAASHDYSAGQLVIGQPVLRVASPVSKTGAGFMTISNKGKVADRLLSVATDASTRSDLHGTVQTGTIMQMRAQAGGVPVPAGARISFAPGGLHVMFIGLKAPVPAGRRIKARLTFVKAGSVDVEFTVVAAAHQH
jgi:copper(I)-binding protein